MGSQPGRHLPVRRETATATTARREDLIAAGPVLALCLLPLAGGPPLSVAARVEAERAVERARYAFVIGAAKPFDEVYPRSVFEKRVERELAQERVLQRVFGLTVTPRVLAEEYDRIEKTTKAPEQWEAVKGALKNDRHLIEEVFCLPPVVERVLRSKFAFDQKIHAEPHRKAREARAAFLVGRTPSGAKVQRLSRKAETAPDTGELLRKSQEDASLPRALAPRELGEPNTPVSIDPEMVRVLEKELKRTGDVTTILEERGRFSVFRLIAITEDAWTVTAVQFPKGDFDGWFEKVRRSNE